MLLNFTFGNYRSFRDQTQFSMMHDGKAADRGWPKPDISTVCAIYGPNAAGKTSLLEAMAYMCDLVAQSYAKGDRTSGIARKPFLLDPTSKSSPSEFFIEFIAADGLRYKYWFSVDGDRVLDETLTAYRTKRPTKLYERYMDDSGRQHIEFGSSLSGPKRQLWELTRPNTLFLSVVGASAATEALPAFEALAHGVGFYSAPSYSAEVTNIKRSFSEHNALSAAMMRVLPALGTGVNELAVLKSEPPALVKKGIARLGETVDLAQDALDNMMEDVSTKLLFGHQGTDGIVWLDRADESSGTESALSFFSMALRVLSTGGTALVDELDGSLHPVLVDEMVRIFADPATNPLQAQLIFTTHDVSLITKQGRDNRAVERDQLWFVQKAADGASELFPATSLSIRPDENMGRNYLNGVYGALPRVDLHRAVADAVSELIARTGTNAGDDADGEA